MDWDELGIDKDEAERLIKGREINQNSLGDNLDADQMINMYFFYFGKLNISLHITINLHFC